MAKDKRIYEPGELQRIRDRLGEISREEAKEMQRSSGVILATKKPLPRSRRAIRSSKTSSLMAAW
jgi:hypothetical protein